MRNLLKPLSLFIGVYLAIVCIFGFAYDTDGDLTKNQDNLVESPIATELLGSSDTLLPVDTSTVIIDNPYTKAVVEQFIDDAVEHGLKREYVIKHIKALDAIIVDDLNQYGLLGVTVYRLEKSSPTGMRGMIVLNKDLLYDLDLYMFTLYHELGHWFGLDHCECKDVIMMNGYDATAVDLIYKDWDKKVKKHMKEIKKGYSRKKHSYDFPDFDSNSKLNYHKFGENIICNHNHIH